jgi:hypothetical protein
MHTTSKKFLTALLAVSLGAGLTGCTGHDEPRHSSASSTKRATTTPTPSATTTAPTTGVCTEGQLTITGQDLDKEHAFRLEEPCDLVAVVTSGADITITVDIRTLSLEGSDNTVTAQHVGEVAAFGQHNTVRHTGDEPSLVDTGSGAPDVTFEQH